MLEFGIKAWHEQITQFTVGEYWKAIFKEHLLSTAIPFQMLQVISSQFSCFNLNFLHCPSAPSSKFSLLILVFILLHNFFISLASSAAPFSCAVL